MDRQTVTGPQVTAQEIDRLLEHGERLYGWRCVAGVLDYCAVEIRFTLLMDVDEAAIPFFARIFALAMQLSATGYRMPDDGDLTVKRAGGKNRPYAAFHCQTPNYGLPGPDPATGRCRQC